MNFIQESCKQKTVAHLWPTISFDPKTGLAPAAYPFASLVMARWCDPLGISSKWPNYQCPILLYQTGSSPAKTPVSWSRWAFLQGVILQQDNARPHVANALQKINQLGWEPLIHPSYSPDCTPSDYHLFASLAHSLAGKNFANLLASKSQEFYSRGIDLLPEKWQPIIDHDGAYFES